MLLAMPRGQFQIFSFTSSQTQARPSATPRDSIPFARMYPSSQWTRFIRMGLLRLSGFADFVDVSDRGFIDQQAGAGGAGQANAVAVIPFDDALYLFTVLQHDDQRSFCLDLLLIIKILGMGLVGGHGFLHPRTAVAAIKPVAPFAAGVGPRRRRVQ